MKNALHTMLMLSVLMFYGCASVIQPSSNVTKQQRSATGFDELEVSDAFTLYITMGDREGIELEASENLHQYIVTEKEGDKLVIKLQQNIQIGDHAVLKAYVSAKEIESIHLSGASACVLQNPMTEDKLKVVLSGASSMKGALDAEHLDIEASGASSLDLTGTSKKLKIDASGASSFGSFAFVADDAHVELSGASRAEVTVNGKLDVDASGASTLNYMGTATIGSQSLGGASQMNKR